MSEPKPRIAMIWNAARGGMRSVVEAYRTDGFLAAENVRLFAAYADGGLVWRQLVLARALAGFAAMLATGRVDLVHIHAAMRGSFWRKGLFASMAQARGVPVLLHLHGSEMKQFYAGQKPRVQRMIRERLERATRVLVLSESWRSFIAQIAPAAQVEVVPNYVRLPAEVPVSARNGREALFLGLVGDRKGVFDLIPAFADVARTRPDARLVIGGNGAVERARAAAEAAGIAGAVSLPGWIGGAQKEALLGRAGIYVLPSHNEGLPMSVLEAMARGLPVITTRVGGIPELVTDGVDGLLIDAGDQTALADALRRLFDDPALRERIGAAARARIAAEYSDTAVLPMLRRIYAECRRPA